MDTPQTDNQLVEQARQGDDAAFALLVNRYADWAYGMAYRMLNDPEDAYDSAQEAFLKVYCSLHKFQGQSSFRTWFFRIVTNVCLDARRKRRRTETFSLDERMEQEGAFEPAGDGPDPESRVLEMELAGHIQEAIASLPAHYRAVVVLRELEDLSYEEIAEILGCSLGTVKSRLNRARSILRELLVAKVELLPDHLRQGRQRKIKGGGEE